MLYDLVQGPVEENIIFQSMKSGQPLPDAIQNAPELDEGLFLFYEAFQELTTSRQIGMSAGPIPWTAVHEYANVLEIYGEQRSDLHYHIREMDNAYLKHQGASSG